MTDTALRPTPQMQSRLAAGHDESRKPADPNQRSADGRTALHWAARGLRQRRCHGPYGETALHTCAHAGNTAAARVLIAAGASVDPGDSWRTDAPHVGCGGGPPRDDAGADRRGRRVDARSTIIEWDRQRTDEPRDKWLPPGGWTPLLLAARENCVAWTCWRRPAPTCTSWIRSSTRR